MSTVALSNGSPSLAVVNAIRHSRKVSVCIIYEMQTQGCRCALSKQPTSSSGAAAHELA